MNRSILVTMLAVLAVALGGIGFLLFRSTGTNTNSDNTNAVNGADNTNTATVLQTVQVNKTLAYRGGSIPVERADVATAVGGFSAAADKSFLVVYLGDGLEVDTSLASWATREVQLLDSDGTLYTPAYVNIPDADTNAGTGGYLAFRVNKGASGFTLRFVRSGEDVKQVLGL